MHHWLSVELGVAGLKRLAKSIDASLAAVHALLADTISEATIHLLVSVNELNGLTAWEERADLLGLRPEDVTACMHGAEQAHACMLKASLACTEASLAYRQLFLWLHRCQKR